MRKSEYTVCRGLALQAKDKQVTPFSKAPQSLPSEDNIRKNELAHWLA